MLSTLLIAVNSSGLWARSYGRSSPTAIVQRTHAGERRIREQNRSLDEQDAARDTHAAA